MTIDNVDYGIIISEEQTGLPCENNIEKSIEFCKNLDTSYLHAWFEDDSAKAYLEEFSKYQELADVIYKGLKPEDVSK